MKYGNDILMPTVARLLQESFGPLAKEFEKGMKANSFVKSTPLVNVIENDEDYTLEVAAPGLKKEDFSIEVKNGVLTIKANVEKTEEEKENGKYIRKEYDFHSFERTFNLDKQKVDSDGINASYNDGILNITLPKKEEAIEKPARTIKVSE